MSKSTLALRLETFFKKNWLFLIILAVGFFLRIFKAQEMFMYGHDQDLAGWFVRDVVENGHLRLIGQETSTQGIFIGPFYYYLLIPFYLLFNMDPIGGIVFITLFGLFSMTSVYFVFSKIFGRNSGIIAALIYSFSYYTVFNDREVVPTTPAIVWTVWYFYALFLIQKNKQKIAYSLLGALIGLIWHLNLALVLIVPLVVVAQIVSKKKLDKKAMFRGIIVFFVFTTPLILFEVRHGFSQVNYFYRSMTTDQYDIISGTEKFLRVIRLNSKNISGLLQGYFFNINYAIITLSILSIFVFLIVKKAIKKELAVILATWIILFIGFFSFYSKILSEYYLNATIVIWIILISISINYLLSKKQLKIVGIIVLSVFVTLNFYKIFTYKVNRSGYLVRKDVVNMIKEDALRNSYPCVSVSYITSPGNDRGYRYFYYLEGMHVNRPASGSPVYTIVYPLRDDIEVNYTAGAIGLIYPDYSVYNIDDIKKKL